MKLACLSAVCAALTGAALFTGGCAAVQELPRQQLAAEQPDNPEQKLARELLIRFVADDAPGFIALLPQSTHEQFGVKEFAATREALVSSIGEPVGFSYLDTLEFPTLTPHIWKVRFKRVNPETQEEFFSEALFRVITGTVDGQPVVIGFNFF